MLESIKCQKIKPCTHVRTKKQRLLSYISVVVDDKRLLSVPAVLNGSFQITVFHHSTINMLLKISRIQNLNHMASPEINKKTTVKITSCFPFKWRDTIDWHEQRLKAVLHISPESVYLQALLAEQTQVLCKLDSLQFLSPVSWQSKKHCDKQIAYPLTLSIKKNSTLVKRHVFHTPVHLTEPIRPDGNTWAHQPPVGSSILGPPSACWGTFHPCCRFNDCVWVGFFWFVISRGSGVTFHFPVRGCDLLEFFMTPLKRFSMVHNGT